jgi:hypothetical protein
MQQKCHQAAMINVASILPAPAAGAKQNRQPIYAG